MPGYIQTKLEGMVLDYSLRSTLSFCRASRGIQGARQEGRRETSRLSDQTSFVLYVKRLFRAKRKFLLWRRFHFVFGVLVWFKTVTSSSNATYCKKTSGPCWYWVSVLVESGKSRLLCRESRLPGRESRLVCRESQILYRESKKRNTIIIK